MRSQRSGLHWKCRDRFSGALSLSGALTLIVCQFGAMPAEAQHVPDADSSEPEASTDATASSWPDGTIQESANLRVTPPRPATAADSARAASIAEELWGSIEKYQDVRDAVADGFVQMVSGPRQKVVHLTNRRYAVQNAIGFDPTRPTSLLYQRAPGGGLVLTGAMFTAPIDASLEELDARVPLGIAQWHLHTNFCVPEGNQIQRPRNIRNRRPALGPGGRPTTKEACEASGGQFRETVFNWMVHVEFAEDGTVTWGH